MHLITLSCKFDLMLPLRQCLFLFCADFSVTMRAADAFFEQWRLTLFRAERLSAGAAELVVTRFQAVADRDALIEDETLALPHGLRFRHGFQVFQNSALQVINLVKALTAHIGGRFFATDAAGAEHGYFRFF